MDVQNSHVKGFEIRTLGLEQLVDFGRCKASDELFGEGVLYYQLRDGHASLDSEGALPPFSLAAPGSGVYASAVKLPDTPLLFRIRPGAKARITVICQP
jgi:hypothetical protein